MEIVPEILCSEQGVGQLPWGLLPIPKLTVMREYIVLLMIVEDEGQGRLGREAV